MKRWLMKNKLQIMLKEAVVAYFKVLPQHLPGRTEESHGNLSQDSRPPGRDLNQRSLEYETGVLTARSRCSVDITCTRIVKYLSIIRGD
jgi:hypothetical protein